MRYVIVSVVEGQAGMFNEEMRRDVLEKFNAKSSKLPAHITVKAPFEYGKDIDELESTIERFCNENKKVRYNIIGYGFFDKRAIYMKVIDNEELRDLHKNFIESINKINYINFGNHEGAEAIFHITIASKKIRDKFNEIWKYVNESYCSFEAEFNNISIFKWEENTWKLYKKYNFR